MRRFVQLVSLLTLVGSALMIAGAGTQAAASATKTIKPAVLQASWFWENAWEQSNPAVAETPPGSEPSGVPAGDLAVAYTSDPGSVTNAALGQTAPSPSSQSSKMTVLAFDLNGVAPGSTVNAFTFSVRLDSSSGAANANTTNAPLVACLPTRMWPASMGGDYTNEPPVDCSAEVKPKVNGTTYTFSIPTLAQSWLTDENFGVALVNDVKNTTQPFQLDFTGPKTVKASLAFTPPAAQVVVHPTPAPSGSGGSSGSTGTASSGGQSTRTASAPAVPAPAPPAIDVAPPLTQKAAPGPPPQMAPSTAPASLATPVKAASSAPGRAFWTAALALAAVLLISSLTLGDTAGPPATGSRSRLTHVLRDRERVAAALTQGSS